MRKIVIVDDDPNMSRLMCILFELEGFEVITAQRYQEILPLIQQVRPDVVLMDVRIQGRETLDVVRQIRREQDLTNIPVLMTSGMDYREQCLDAGANCFLLKPFIPDEMVRMVGTLLGTDESFSG